MKNTIRLAFAYLKYYKKQTLSLFLGILLSASILTGIGSLMGSGRNATLENARGKAGDWHYYVRCDFPWFREFQGHTEGKGYKVEKFGVLTIRKVLEEPTRLPWHMQTQVIWISWAAGWNRDTIHSRKMKWQWIPTRSEIWIFRRR